MEKNIFNRFYRQTLGSVAVMAALAFPVIIGVAGLGVDASVWMAKKQDLQTAADAGVIAAGWELATKSNDYMDYAAEKEAMANGYNPDANGNLTLAILTEEEDGSYTIGLTVSEDSEALFSRFFTDKKRISAYAEARVDGVDGNFCFLSLDRSADDAFTSFGSVDLSAPSCGIAVNSSSDQAFTLSGNVDVLVNNVRISGYYDVTGGAADFQYNSLKTNKAPIDDPYEDLEVPAHAECPKKAKALTVNSDTTLSPGLYCGGISISGNNDIVFEPGVYIIFGGSLKVTGGGTLSGEEVSIILTGEGNDYAQVDISGSRQINLTPPKEGDDFEGVAFFQDRNAPSAKNLQNKIVGTSGINIEGVLYFPSQGLWFGGDAGFAGGADPCTILIAKTITIAGNPSIGNNCDNVANRDIEIPDVTLIR
ncbi:MAG: Tad domain-containing protein [Rhodospirillales bacterium]|nr:Tad domain-containing protein [Rhodospirillales bacterium]